MKLSQTIAAGGHLRHCTRGRGSACALVTEDRAIQYCSDITHDNCTTENKDINEVLKNTD